MTMLTVLMTVYNGERYLQQAVASILNQTYSDFEFIIVDDGSTDATHDILHAFSDPRIRLIHNPTNTGLTSSLNRGIRQARGDFIARQDADDISEPDRLATQLAFLHQHPEVALLGSWFTEIDADNAPLARKQLPCDTFAIRWMLLFVSAFVHSAVVIRRSVLEDVGLYNEQLTYAMDYDLWQRIARHNEVANLDQYLIRYRLHAAAMSTAMPHYRTEADDLTLDGLAVKLGWNRLSPQQQEVRLHNMKSLLFFDPRDVPARALAGTIIQSWRLHGAFCRRQALAPRTLLKKRQMFLAHLIRMLALSLRKSTSQRLRRSQPVHDGSRTVDTNGNHLPLNPSD